MSVRSKWVAATTLFVANVVSVGCGVERPLRYSHGSGGNTGTPSGTTYQDAASDAVHDASATGTAEHPGVADPGCFSSVTIDGGAPFSAICPARCPPGMICVIEMGKGRGQYCAPIPDACGGVPTCECMGRCVCTNVVGGFPEACAGNGGAIACDNGVR